MKSRGLAQIPLMIILLLMAIAVPAATKLVQKSADTRNLAAYTVCTTIGKKECTGTNSYRVCLTGGYWGLPNGCRDKMFCYQGNCVTAYPTATPVVVKCAPVGSKTCATSTSYKICSSALTWGSPISCPADKFCSAGECVWGWAGGAACTANPQCTSKECTFAHCEPLTLGQRCSLDSQCASKACVGLKCVASGKPGGAACTANPQCASKECTFAFCEPHSLGQKCSLSSQCRSGVCKSTAGLICYAGTDCTCRGGGISPTKVPSLTPTKIPTAKPTAKPTVKPTVGPCKHDNECPGPCAYCANGRCISGCTTPTFGPKPSVKPTVGPGTPTSIKPTTKPTSPVGTIVPGTCKECPREFKCYRGDDSEYKWFVNGYVMEGFVLADSNAVQSCEAAGVPKPTFLGKSKGDANCDGSIDVIDYSLWNKEYFDGGKGAVKKSTWNADFTGNAGKCDGIVDTYDYSLWQKNFSELM